VSEVSQPQQDDQNQQPEQEICPKCAELSEMNRAMEEFISRMSAQLLSAEMLDIEMEQIFTACADPMIVIRLDDGIVVRANQQMLTLLNKKNDQIIGMECSKVLTPAECALIKPSRKTKQTDIELCTSTGTKINYIITTSRLITLDGSPGMLAQYKDITERKQAEQALEQAHAALKRVAEIDGLTQIPNRRTFDETLVRMWQQLGESQQPLAAILCDIDFFKKYNDTYGHQQGDSCLISVAQALYATLPNASGIAARYGGEEFIFLLPNCELEAAVTVAEQARHNIEQLNLAHRSSDVVDHVTLSLGVACIIPNENSSAKQLIEAADCALYAAKKNGRNRVSCAT